MIAYITFNVYDYSEFNLWDIATKKKEAVEKFKKENLPYFFDGGQPDISALELRRVELSKSDYNFLKNFLEVSKTSNEDEKKVEKMLSSFYKNNEDDYIFSFTGDEIIDVVKHYCKKNSIDIPDDDFYEVIDEVAFELNKDKEKFVAAISEYIG